MVAEKRTKILIVDGYNVLRSGSRYRSMRAQPDHTFEKYNQVREALISDVAAFAGSEYQSVTVVFDGGDNAESAGKVQKVGRVKVMFSPYGSSADKVIEKLAHDAREKNYEVLVVTSDATIQDTVFGGMVTRMSANGFSLEADDLQEEARTEDRAATKRKATVADRLDTSTLSKLKALRDRL